MSYPCVAGRLIGERTPPGPTCIMPSSLNCDPALGISARPYEVIGKLTLFSFRYRRSQKNAKVHICQESAQFRSHQVIVLQEHRHHFTRVEILHLCMNQASTRARSLTGEKGVRIAASYGLGIGRGEPRPESPSCMGATGDAAASGSLPERICSSTDCGGPATGWELCAGRSSGGGATFGVAPRLSRARSQRREGWELCAERRN